MSKRKDLRGYQWRLTSPDVSRMIDRIENTSIESDSEEDEMIRKEQTSEYNDERFTHGSQNDERSKRPAFHSELPEKYARSEIETALKAMDNFNIEEPRREYVQTSHTRFTFKDIEEAFEKFSGDEEKDIEEWLRDFEDQAQIFKWNDLEKMIYGRRLLTKQAKLFVNSELKPRSYEQFKNGLIKEFKKVVNSALIHRKLSGTRKASSESFHEYCYKMIEIAQPANIDTRGLITYIVDGIDDHFNNKLFLYHAQTISELKEKMKTYNELSKRKTYSRKATRSDDGRNPEKNETKNGKEERPGEVCYNCGSKQHRQWDCPDRENGPRCFNCGSFGHKSPDCLVPKREKKESNAESRPLMGALFIPSRHRIEKSINLGNIKMDTEELKQSYENLKYEMAKLKRNHQREITKMNHEIDELKKNAKTYREKQSELETTN